MLKSRFKLGMVRVVIWLLTGFKITLKFENKVVKLNNLLNLLLQTGGVNS